jgi:hypothetical protein
MSMHGLAISGLITFMKSLLISALYAFFGPFHAWLAVFVQIIRILAPPINFLRGCMHATKGIHT